MISKKMNDALNLQINKELYSSYLYLAMAAYSNSAGLTGFETWFKAQAKEEAGHAMKIYEYINEQGGRVVLKAIDMPAKDYASAEQAMKETLSHEKEVTKSIYDLVALAKKLEDYGTEIFLQWFVTEQIEEEATVSGILQKLEMGANRGNGLLMLDHRLGERTAS